MSKSNLDKALDHPGYPRMVPHPYALHNPGDWAVVCSALFLRHVFNGECLPDVCKDLRIDINLADHLLKLMRAHIGPGTRKHYLKSRVGTGLVPPFVVRDLAVQRTNTIGRAIFTLASWDAFSVRHAMSIYDRAVTTDKQIVLVPAKEKHCEYARALIEFVLKLKVDGLGIRLVGYKNSKGKHADLDAFKENHGLPENTPERLQKARNPDADSPAEQVGLEVVRTTSSGDLIVDDAFFVSLILGAVVEAWRFAVRKPASKGKPSNVPITAQRAPREVHSLFKLPPAVLLGSLLKEDGSSTQTRASENETGFLELLLEYVMAGDSLLTPGMIVQSRRQIH